jgi:signal transduction histidine kinase
MQTRYGLSTAETTAEAAPKTGEAALPRKRVYRMPEVSFDAWSARASRRSRQPAPVPDAPAAAVREPARRFNLLRWFSILGFVAVSVVSLALATILSEFVTREILEHDALLTDQVITSIGESQASRAMLGPQVTSGEVLDERVDLAKLGVSAAAAQEVKDEFYGHLRFLPDVLRAQVYAPDRTIVWSTVPALIVTVSRNNAELEKAIATRTLVATRYGDVNHDKPEQRLLDTPQRFFLESYMPLLGKQGQVVAVVETYKEPRRLLETIHRGKVLVWISTALGAVFLYLSLFWIVRRADRTLIDQQQRLVEAEALCVIGEMSAAVAHGIRNPLASIRSSAELALDGDLASTRKNANDIIVQIDRLGKWVRDLLVFSRPLSAEIQQIDLAALVDGCLANFATQLEKNGVACSFQRPSAPLPAVVGERGLATQALANVISNAIEAMPRGGSLRLEIKPTGKANRLAVVVTDTGAGMSSAEMDLVFKPYYTTKRQGLGLGMALVKRIMERFGGAITLQSREGEGTRVELHFKVA